MKISKILSIISLVVFTTASLFAQEETLKKKSFKVWGNCEMCKTTIEKPFKKMEGVKSAKWNIASNKMTVKYDASVISLGDIKKTIASVGYDTEEFRAPDEVYSKLHGCCQYERPAAKAD